MPPTAPATAPALPVVAARGLTKRYGDRLAVDAIDFDVRAGECFGFLGPNGAGKSTVMRMMYGFTPMTAGSLHVLGMDVTRHPRRIKRRIGVVPQANNLDPDNTVWQNLVIYSRYHGIPRREAARRANEALEMFALEDRRDAQIDELSGGMQRRLVMARALLNQPEVVLLDEPTTGLDPQARRVVWRTLRRLLAQGYTMVLTTHYLDEAERLCDRLVMIDEGRIVLEGTPKALIAGHVGTLVLEADLGEHVATVPSMTLDAIERAGLEHAYADGTLSVYAPGRSRTDAETLLESIPVGDASQRALRAGSLEDVFLRTTGYQLREER